MDDSQGVSYAMPEMSETVVLASAPVVGEDLVMAAHDE